MRFRTRLRNGWTLLFSLFSNRTLFREPDGRLVDIDDWSGYDNCWRPGCGHYRCEHGFGEKYKVIYAKDKALEGTEGWDPVGCMNAGCPCEGFMEDDFYVIWDSQVVSEQSEPESEEGDH